LGPNVACRLLQLRYDVRALARALESSQGRRPQPPSFSDVPRSLPCGSGTHAASRAPSTRRDPGVGSSCFRRFSRPRCPVECATGDGLRRLRVVTIDVHGPLDRAKDASPTERCNKCPSMGACAFARMRTAFPFSATQRTPRCRRRGRRKRRRPLSTKPDRPRPPFQRRPAKGDAIPKTEVPSTVAPAESQEDRSSNLHSGLPLTPPTRFPMVVGTCFRGALQARERRGLRSCIRESERLFNPLESRAWD
jgi:hypothetical protein